MNGLACTPRVDTILFIHHLRIWKPEGKKLKRTECQKSKPLFDSTGRTGGCRSGRRDLTRSYFSANKGDCVLRRQLRILDRMLQAATGRPYDIALIRLYCSHSARRFAACQSEHHLQFFSRYIHLLATFIHAINLWSRRKGEVWPRWPTRNGNLPAIWRQHTRGHSLAVGRDRVGLTRVSLGTASKTSLSCCRRRTRATRFISPVAWYTELDAECHKQVTIVRRLSTALGDGGHAVAKFFEVQNGVILISLKHNVERIEEKLYAKKQLDLCRNFETIRACGRHTDTMWPQLLPR